MGSLFNGSFVVTKHGLRLLRAECVQGAPNEQKHGVSFDRAALVFFGPFVIVEADRIEGGEQRWRALGMAGGQHLLLVAHAWPEVEGEVEVVRIIPARRADRRERRRYEDEAR